MDVKTNMDLPSPTRRLMSIDPGSRAGLGIAISDIGEDGMVNLYANTVDLVHQAKIRSIPNTYYARSEMLSCTIAHMGRAWNVQEIVCEGNYYRGLPQPFKVLTQVVDAIRVGSALFLGHGDIAIIDPTTVKRSVGVSHKGTDKDDMARAIKSGLLGLTLQDDVFTDSLDQHAVDAIAIGYAYFKGSPEYEYFKARASARQHTG